MKILVIEDSRDMLTIYEYALEKHGHEVVTATSRPSNGVLPVDVAIVDYQLKHETGADVVQALREDQPDLPVVYATAATGAKVLESLDSDNRTTIVRKPFAINDLFEAINCVIKGSCD